MLPAGQFTIDLTGAQLVWEENEQSSLTSYHPGDRTATLVVNLVPNGDGTSPTTGGAASTATGAASASRFEVRVENVVGSGWDSDGESSGEDDVQGWVDDIARPDASNEAPLTPNNHSLRSLTAGAGAGAGAGAVQRGPKKHLSRSQKLAASASSPNAAAAGRASGASSAASTPKASKRVTSVVKLRSRVITMLQQQLQRTFL